MKAPTRKMLSCIALTCTLALDIPQPSYTPSARVDAQPWGACGRSTEERKIVRVFTANRSTDFTLRCGGPKYSSEPTWGYRHILKEHRRQFEILAVGTFQNWRDIADLAMSKNSTDPDHVKPAGAGKTCRSRVIYLINLRTNQVHRTAIIRMFTNESGDIITAYPSTHCK